MLAALKDMYGEVKLRVRAAGALGGEFRSDRGVKQGGPLSLLLFGLLLGRIERVFNEDLDGYGRVSVGGSGVSMLLYAHDLAIMGEIAGTVQRALHLLSRCCSCLRMQVNVSKSVGMVLNPRFHRGPAVSWSYNAEQMEMVDSFKYLGPVIDARGGVGKA